MNSNNTKTQVDIALVYGQEVQAVELNMLYQAIYTAERINKLVVEPVTDTSKLY